MDRGEPGSFSFTVRTPLSPGAALARILDVEAHGRVVPLTRGRGPAPQDVVVGDYLVARTGVGRWGFDDVMEVLDLNPGRDLRLQKVGAVIGGSIVVVCEAEASGTAVSWQQELAFPWLPHRLSQLVARLVAPVVRQGYVRVVRRLLEPRPEG